MPYIDTGNMEMLAYDGKVGGFTAIFQALIDRDTAGFMTMNTMFGDFEIQRFSNRIRREYATYFSFPQDPKEKEAYGIISSNDFTQALMNYRITYNIALTPYAVKSILNLYMADSIVEVVNQPFSSITDLSNYGKILGLATDDSQVSGANNTIFNLPPGEEAPCHGLIKWVYCTKVGDLIYDQNRYDLMNFDLLLPDHYIVYQIDIGPKKESLKKKT